MELALKATCMCHRVKIAIICCQEPPDALNICTYMGDFQHVEFKFAIQFAF